MWGTVASIAISVVALTVSAVTLWRTHLAPSKIVAAYGSMIMRIHRMKGDRESWLLPHFAASVGFTNSGTQIGRIHAIRAVVRYTALPIPGAHEVFSCHGEYDAVKYQRSSRRRFEMIRKAMIGDFVPLIILPKTTVTKFYVFDSRWDRSVRQRGIRVELEIVTDRSPAWTKIGTWNFDLGAFSWNELEGGSSCSVDPEDSMQRWEDRYPEDLHKYTLDAEMYEEEHEPVGPTTEVSGQREGGPVEESQP